MSRQPNTFSYFVIAIDYGRDGIEAIVNPEMTRRGAIEKVREILGDRKEIAFVHHITMNDVPQDVTAEFKGEASFEAAMAAIDDVLSIDMQAARFDHAHDLRKHEVA